MKIIHVEGARDSYKELLKIGDPSEVNVRRYINQGSLLALYRKGICIGVLHYRPSDQNTVEISNISLLKAHRKKGIGKQLMAYAIEQIKYEGYKKIVIGTGNSSIDNIAFYQKIGFQLTDIWKGYFELNYKRIIYENGIRCRHMLRFEYIIK